MRGLAALGVDLPADAFAYRTAVKEALARTREHMDARRFRFGPGHVHVQQKQAALRSGYDASAQHARLVGTLCPSVVARYAQRGEPPLFELHRTSRTRPTKSPTPKPSTAAPTPSPSTNERVAIGDFSNPAPEISAQMNEPH